MTLTGIESPQYHPHMAMTAEPCNDSGEAAIGEAAAMRAATCLFRGFGDPSRLTIVQHLALGDHRVVDLTGHLGLAQSTVSRHLACLLDCGLVQVRAKGRASVYSLARPEETMALLSAAERLLAATGDAVALCPNHVELGSEGDT